MGASSDLRRSCPRPPGDAKASSGNSTIDSASSGRVSSSTARPRGFSRPEDLGRAGRRTPRGRRGGMRRPSPPSRKPSPPWTRGYTLGLGSSPRGTAPGDRFPPFLRHLPGRMGDFRRLVLDSPDARPPLAGHHPPCGFLFPPSGLQRPIRNDQLRRAARDKPENSGDAAGASTERDL